MKQLGVLLLPESQDFRAIILNDQERIASCIKRAPVAEFA